MTVTFQPSAVDAKMASGAQAHFILTLQGMPKDDDNRAEAALAIMETMTMKEASALITTLKASPIAPATPKVVAPKFQAEKGQWHCIGDKFYLIAKAQSSGKLYAKERKGGGGFDYAPGILFKLSNETVVGPQHAAVAAAFGKLTNHCVFCYAAIDTPESMTAGYGPVCAAKRDLPWG